MTEFQKLRERAKANNEVIALFLMPDGAISVIPVPHELWVDFPGLGAELVRTAKDSHGDLIAQGGSQA